MTTKEKRTGLLGWTPSALFYRQGVLEKPREEPAMAISPVTIARKHAAASQMNSEEWQARIDLAACYRLVAHFGMDDLFATHISARAPGEHAHFLINPYGLLFAQVTASNLVKVDLDGTIVGDSPYSINPAGLVIHSAIHAARPEIACVIHTHTVAGMAVSCLKDGLLPISQKSMRFYNRIAYHDYEGKADDLDERARLVRSLGPHNALILRNHGLLTCGVSVLRAFRAMLNLEKCCKTQLAAQATGAPLIELSPNLMEHAAGQFDRDDVTGGSRPDGWPALLALLDSIDPTYKS
jgi:ribulose-5-phosphate 4-epimerase/fuculose-1-phosphate aldolase